jgi:hypothetical protein
MQRARARTAVVPPIDGPDRHLEHLGELQRSEQPHGLPNIERLIFKLFMMGTLDARQNLVKRLDF